MAAYIKAQEWEPGSRVAILSKNCAWWIMADLAIWMAGHVSVPIYPSLRPHSVRHILEHSESRACFVGATDEHEAVLHGVPAGVMCIAFPTAPPGSYPSWDELASTHPPMSGTPLRVPDELATIIYTSGTTGVPKGVMHCFAAFAYFANTIAPFLGLSGEDRVLSYLPLAHIVERAGVEALTFTLGSQIFFTEGLDTFFADLHRARPSLFLSVPRILLKFQQGVFAAIPRRRLETLMRIPGVSHFIKRKILKRLGLETVRYAACGAAPLPPDLLLWYRNLGLELEEGFGMTEILITHLPRPGEVRPGFVGTPLDGVEAKIGEGGELLVRSPMNMLGYYKEPQATMESFTGDGFFRTGDVASIESGGQLKIIGRLKEQFKTSKGKYVAPAPIESKLIANPDVEACCLMGSGLPSPFAVILLTPEARQRCTDAASRAALERTLHAQLNQVNSQLDPHERVAYIAIADGPWSIQNGLITPTLKIRRGALESHYERLSDRWRLQKDVIVWETVPCPTPQKK